MHAGVFVYLLMYLKHLGMSLTHSRGFNDKCLMSIEWTNKLNEAAWYLSEAAHPGSRQTLPRVNQPHGLSYCYPYRMRKDTEAQEVSVAP